ncbi:septum formation family protein [Microbispora sp. RL4-1S]|uniref:Septum formation family protein n=1 Tax=Microbispora oryzae TaxID=2806554 RepID=A0A940WHF9_9ACTN|nr:septum formation family protein [Microbispora oryzae]MBP2705601.1 septum formation family protein [Microbispora oryzae]
MSASDPPYGPPYPPPGEVPPPPRVSRLAVTALVAGALSAVPLSVACGVAALVRIRRHGGRGRGLAVAGLVLSGVWVAAAAVLYAGFYTGHAGSPQPAAAAPGTLALRMRPPAPSPPPKDLISILTVRTGDCLSELVGRQMIGAVRLVPCGKPHEAEVGDQFRLPASAWPGKEKVIRTAMRQCIQRMRAALAGNPELSHLEVRTFTPPSKAAWEVSRTVSCMVTDLNGAPLRSRLSR